MVDFVRNDTIICQLFMSKKSTSVCPNENPFSWDTDGIQFVVDSSATAIISKKCKSFTEN